jgi:hypothetical protein
MSNFSVANTMLWNQYDNTIVISLNIISKDLRLLNIDAFYDLLSKHYKNQTIVFKDGDGINFYDSSFLDLLRRVQIALEIPDKDIIFESIVAPHHSMVIGCQKSTYLKDFSMLLVTGLVSAQHLIWLRPNL